MGTKSNCDDSPDENICAICWDTMVSWRRLPCRHDFHEHCLCSWLEQNATCPTCRLDLAVPLSLLPNQAHRARSNNVAFGVLMRNLINTLGVDNQTAGRAQPNTPAQQQQQQQPNVMMGQNSTELRPNQIVGLSRIFSSFIGFNLGMNVGPGSLISDTRQMSLSNNLSTESTTSANEEITDFLSSQNTDTESTTGNSTVSIY